MDRTTHGPSDTPPRVTEPGGTDAARTKHNLRSAFEQVRPESRDDLARKAALSGVLGAVLGDDAPTMCLGDYALGEIASKGGMGVVHRARRRSDGADVAVKIMFGATDCARARFAREVETLQALSHPNVVRFVDHGIDDDGAPYLVMAWLDGRDLCTVLRSRQLGVDEAVAMGSAVADGLSVAHAHGVLHRDVKPSNVFLLGGGPTYRREDVRVIDFGLAGVLDGSSDLTARSELLGTPQFMAPEQLEGDAELRSDVYGLGATLYSALTGQPPFHGRSPIAIALAVGQVPAPCVQTLRPDVPDALAELIAAMMAKDPAHRPQTMGEVESALAALG